MNKRVLILSATSGNGHVRAAQALEKAFRQCAEPVDVKHIDALQYTSPMFRNLYSRAYLRLVNNAPHVLGYVYDAADKPWRAENRRLAFDRLNALPLIRQIVDYEADLIVCTHFMPAEIVSWLLAKKRVQAKHAVIVTDFDAHAMWLTRNYDVYFAAMEETREHLVSMGLERNKIEVTGIPIDPVFAEIKDKREMRLKYGLSPDRTVVMLSAGGFGVGNMEALLEQLCAVRHPLQVLAMCGQNQRLYADVTKLAGAHAEQHPGSQTIITPVSFTKTIDEYMSAADMIVGKPGGLTTCEALAKSLVFVIVNPIPGQEERNSDHLLEESCAIRCNNLPALAYKIDRLLDDQSKFAELSKNAQRLARPHAATEIVQRLMVANSRARV
jgi:processive 1,2-diacylglycerol beta-glucosyltransferase